MPTLASTVLFLCSGNYYRSRFAELIFNHHVACTSLPYRADSAGLMPNCRARNPGWISAEVVLALQARGVPLPCVHRAPRDVREHDICGAAMTIALKEAEHRPLVVERFPALLSRVEFWNVDDVGDAPPSRAIPMIERNVRALIARLEYDQPWRLALAVKNA